MQHLSISVSVVTAVTRLLVDNAVVLAHPTQAMVIGPMAQASLPHDVVLREVIAGGEVVGGPLAGRTRGAGELVCQVLVGLARRADPAAVLTWARPQRSTFSLLRGRCCVTVAPSALIGVQFG